MVRTKQTARGSSAPRPGGMATAKFVGRGRGDPEAQFADDPFDIADITGNTATFRVKFTLTKLQEDVSENGAETNCSASENYINS